MPYESYTVLRELVEQREQQLVDRYQSACNFIPPETPKRGVKSGLDKAHEIFSQEYRMLKQIKEDLHTAAQATYKDHPNPEMRKFWGIES